MHSDFAEPSGQGLGISEQNAHDLSLSLRPEASALAKDEVYIGSIRRDAGPMNYHRALILDQTSISIRRVFLGLTLATLGVSSPARAAVEWKPYGFLLPNIEVSSSAVESFSQPNMSAPTAAGNPSAAVAPDRARSTFEVAQSRLGTKIIPSDKVMGQVEIDFIDFTKASPTTAALSRLRIAKIEYSINENHRILFGQDWDLFSPLGPHSMNFVGHYFEAGDGGFMRHQLQLLSKCGDFEIGSALGLSTANATSRDSTVELARLPTLALRGAYKRNDGTQLGASIIGTRIETLLADRTYLNAYGTNLFGQIKLGNTEFRSEMIYGQNLFNLGSLTLSHGYGTTSIREISGWMSFKSSLAEKVSLFGGGGLARVINGQKVLVSTASPSTGPGIRSNFTMRLGAEYKIQDGLSVYLENSYFQTRHQLAAADLARFSPVRRAMLMSSGFLLTF